MIAKLPYISKELSKDQAMYKKGCHANKGNWITNLHNHYIEVG